MTKEILARRNGKRRRRRKKSHLEKMEIISTKKKNIFLVGCNHIF